MSTSPIQERRWTGYGALIVGVTLFSTVEIASKALSNQADVDAFLLVFIRFFVTALVLLGVSCRSWLGRIKEFSLSDWSIFLLNGVLGITLSISLFHLAILTFRNASSSAVVFSANPVFVTIFARFINNEGWSVRKWISVILGCIGIGLFAWESGNPTSESILGMTLMILSAVLFALSVCFSRRHVRRFGAVPFMGFSSLFGSILVLPVGLWRMQTGTMEALQESWILVGYIAVLGTAVAYAAYYFGLSRTSAYQASMSFFLKPVLASVLSVILLGETLNAWTVIGTCLILSGLVLAMLRRKGSADRHIAGKAP